MSTLGVRNIWKTFFKAITLSLNANGILGESHLDRHVTYIEWYIRLHSDVCVSLIWSWKTPLMNPSLASMLIDFVKRESETDMSQRLLVKKYDTPRPTGYKQEMMYDELQTKKVLFP